VTPEYFGTVGVRLVEGMTFEAEAIRGVLDVAIVNEALAARLRPHGPVVGQRIQTSTFSGRVVGIVGDHVDEAPDRPADPQFFRPHPPDVPVTIGLVRARGELTAARARVRAVVDRTWGAGTPIYFTVMSDEVARVTAPWRGRAIFLSLLAALCLPLAIAGLVGALSYDTRGRAHEIAVRLALGADPARIRRRVVTRALGLVALGLAAGLGGGWLVGRLMDSYLFGVRAADATTMAGVGGVLVLCAWLAALGPAWRASRVDPALTLRRM
jgi:putative ABC transport system permease protein